MRSDVPQILAESLDKINKETYRVLWAPERVTADYCQRSIESIEGSGEINFSSPCADLGILCALALDRLDLEAILVLAFVERPWRPVKFQCNVEVVIDGLNYAIGFSESAIHVFQGDIVETPQRWAIFRQEFRRENGEGTSFLEYFHEDGLHGLKTLYPNYIWEADVRWHQRRNRLWRFHWTRLRTQHKKGSTVYSGIRHWTPKG
ncbi:MAG: hypothetical protein P1V97_20250 [Planctomycetota bacterium]|nr:hypothetical protein [Planctomycetota bacterium]